MVSLMSFGLVGLFLTGCTNNAATGHSTTPAYGIPGDIVWNGTTYATGDNIKAKQLGNKLGVVKDKTLKYPVYSVKGYEITKEIAIEVHIPDKRFVVAVNKK
jgi:phospholipase/lecithinase/hemolysin